MSAFSKFLDNRPKGSRKCKYDENQTPNIIKPKQNELYRFLLGRLDKDGKKPLVALCMNPSAANDKWSDATVNIVIEASKELGYSGWLVVNIYPEREPNQRKLGEFKDDLAKKNIKAIKDFLLERKITEVWGAWGDLKCKSLKRAKEMILEMLKEQKIKIFHFADTTKLGNPRHPNPRLLSMRPKVTKENKRYWS
ncbi:MAG: DUF1643 domain-containing protein [Fibromonadaceae bacterium]|jgi:hypothetical protein|nr:DUF1643 domain-containing protein [Fibromonadaceae bacterium]